MAADEQASERAASVAMEAERIVYTRRSTTTKITRRTSVSGPAASSNRDNNNENDHQIGAGAEVEAERSSKRRQPGNQRRKGAADNGAGAAERMFAANNSAPAAQPTSVVVTRPSGNGGGSSVQLSQTQSDARHHHYQPEQQQQQPQRQQQQHQRNSDDGQQQQKVRRLLIREPPLPPASIRRLDNNYASGNIRSGCETGAAAPETSSSSGQPRQHQQQPQRMLTGGRPNRQQPQEQQLLLLNGAGDDDDDGTEERLAARNRHCDPHYYYHHYCDSQLSAARSLAAPALMAANERYDRYAGAADYDENILLFATEHSNQPEQQQQAKPKLKRSHLSSSYSTPSIAGRHCRMATGRFVNYYPSWRQTQSPATCNTNQYSFHVPFEQQLHSAAGQRTASNNMHYRTTRYGFVAPAERVVRDPSSASRQSFRSQEMLHLPSLLKLSCAPATPSATTAAAGRQTPLVVDQSERSSRFGYENIDYAVEDSGYFQAPPSSNNNNNNNKSEPLLLCRPTTKTTATAERARATSANYLNVHSGVRIAEAEGFDNPFKPGTQLSWEADMMVKLMARGYPIQELPQLIEAAKQVARARSHEQHQQQQQRQPEKESAVVEKQLISGANKRAPRKPSRQNAATTTIVRDRNKSSDDLRIVADNSKQIWASSLSRAKSMPRFNAIPSDAVAANERDSDSIDKLIASIEKEMSEILSQNPPLGKSSGEKSKTLPGIYQGAPGGKDLQDEQHVLEKESAKTLSDTRLFNSAVRMPKLAGKQPKVSNRNNNNNNNKTGNKSKNRRLTKSANRTGDDHNNKSSGDLNDNDADASSQQQQGNQVIMKRSRSECCKIH